MATTAAVRRLLTPTSLPSDLVDELLAEVSAVWLMGEPAEVLASDLVLCHPPLGPAEVRAVAKPTADASAWRITVAAHDRVGLLAALAGALADQGLSITHVSATVLPGPGLSLQRVTAKHAGGQPMEQSDWDEVGARLQAVLGRDEPVLTSFSPTPPVTVECQPQDFGRVLVTVEAPDKVGLLWAIASWFAEHEANIETCRATSEDGVARDTFVVVGTFDSARLGVHIGGGPVSTWNLPAAAKFGVRATVAAGALAAGLTPRIVRAVWRRRR
jgi:predicted amino acid-binding ACT domain protein